jgi:hypothetical protein
VTGHQNWRLGSQEPKTRLADALFLRPVTTAGAVFAMRSVVVAGREDDDLCFGDDVDEAVLVVDPP